MEELIELAREKGFTNNNFWLEIFHNPKTFIGIEEAEYFWMCLLQKWLREEYEMWVKVDAVDSLKEWYWCIDAATPSAFETLDSGYEFKTYEEALQSGLLSALKEIE